MHGNLLSATTFPKAELFVSKDLKFIHYLNWSISLPVKLFSFDSRLLVQRVSFYAFSNVRQLKSEDRYNRRIAKFPL